MKECPNQQKTWRNATAPMNRANARASAVNVSATTGPSGELPACYFTPEVERTYDRSIARFLRANR